MRITLRQLAVFVAIAREGSVTRAADQIAISQSAASMALADLESALDCPLFDRLGKRLQLNSMGQHLLPQALEILGRVDALEQAAHGELQQIDLRLGATLTVADYRLPDLLAGFVRHYPAARLDLQVGNTRQIIEAVSQFQLDLGLIEGSCHLPQIETHAWSQDELVVFCAPDHVMADLQPNQPDALVQAEWIVREEGSGTRELFDRVILGDLPQACIRLTLGHTEALIKVVASGAGLGCVSRLAVQPLAERGELVIIPTPFWALQRPFSLIMHRNKYQSAGLKRFLDFCQNTAQEPCPLQQAE